MTDQDIRSELKMLYISMETFSGIKMAFNDYANTLDATDSKRQAISSAFDSDDEDILPTSGVGLMLTLKLFLLYVANGNGRVTAQQLSYIDKMVDDDILSASVSDASLMAQTPSFNEGPLYPIKILDVLIRNDSMSKYLHPENNNQSGAIRCVRVFSELGRGVISLDKNAVSTQRYREFIQNLRDLAIESGNGAYSKADFAFVSKALKSLPAANVAGTTTSAKAKASAGKSAVGCVRAACVEGGNAFLYRVETQVLPGSGEYDFNGPVPENILHRVMQTAFKNLIFYGSNFLNSIDSTKDYYVHIIAPNSTLPDLPAELAAMLSFHSAITGQPVSEDLIVLGSIDMDGALVAPEKVDKLLRLCAEAGAKRVLLPVNAAASIKEIPSEFELVYFSTPQEALSKVFESETAPAAVAKKTPAKKSAPKKTTTTQKKPAPSAESMNPDGYLIVGTGERKIKQRMFKNRLDLEKIEIAEGVQQINSNAFDGCGNLKEIRLPSSLTKIDVAAFNGCKNLCEVALPDGMAEIGNHAFSSCEKLQEIVLPDSVTKIGKGAFAGCKGLQKVVLSRNLTCIQERAFNGCSNLKEIHLPDSLRTIESAAFGNSGIVKVVLPKGMEKLDLGAFQKTHELRRIYIPDSVTEVRGWSSLDKNVEWISMSSATAEKSAHANCDIQRFLKKIELRGVDDAEKERIIRCVEDDGTLRLMNPTEIQKSEFSGRKDLKKIVVPEGVTKIG